ncbi:hypothetical protein D3C81_1721080 [compost metagenome]
MFPIGTSRFLVTIEPRISNPPVEPPTRSEAPIPPAEMMPPNTAPSRGSLVTCITGMIAINQVVLTTDMQLRTMYLRPTAFQPHTISGILSNKYTMEIFHPVT